MKLTLEDLGQGRDRRERGSGEGRVPKISDDQIYERSLKMNSNIFMTSFVKLACFYGDGELSGELSSRISNLNFFNENLETFFFDIFSFKHFKTGNLLLHNFTYLLSLLIVTCAVSIAAKSILTVTVIKCVAVVSARRKFLIGFNDG